MMRRKIGDIKDPEEWCDSEHKAHIAYYINEVRLSNDNLRKYAEKIKELEFKINELHTTFSYLKERYPEEFV